MLTLHITEFNVWQWNHFIFAPLPPCKDPGTSVHAPCCSNSQTTRRIFSSIWQVPLHPQRLDSSGEMFGRVSQYLSNVWCYFNEEETILFLFFFFAFCLYLIADSVDADMIRGKRERRAQHATKGLDPNQTTDAAAIQHAPQPPGYQDTPQLVFF